MRSMILVFRPFATTPYSRKSLHIDIGAGTEQHFPPLKEDQEVTDASHGNALDGCRADGVPVL
jgi:hypothetical protein